MDKEYLQHILDKISNNSATDEELEMYNSWCNAMQESAEAPDQSAMEDAQTETLRYIHKEIKATGPANAIIRNLRYSAAAAAIIVFVGFGLFMYKQQHKTLAVAQTPTSKQTVKADIAPGKDGATLTLADGKKVSLSDLKPGEFAKQNGMIISKTAGNQLIYQADVASDYSTNKTAYNTLNTARGEQYSLVLPDGTKVWLNSATVLKFPASFKGLAKREVELSGEAYFEVVANSKQPFAVHTAKQYIEDIGTQFNVNSYDDNPSVKTTLLEGAVRINEKTMLKPGQQGVSASEEVKVRNVNTSAVVAWKNGYFEFDGENIHDIMKQIARWYDVEVIYEGRIPSSTMVGSMTRFTKVSDVLNVIQQTGKFTFKIDQRKIYVSATFQ
jgi:ferric-dicitrate binding protein FerR (iron transport regulator)